MSVKSPPPLRGGAPRKRAAHSTHAYARIRYSKCRFRCQWAVKPTLRSLSRWQLATAKTQRGNGTRISRKSQRDRRPPDHTTYTHAQQRFASTAQMRSCQVSAKRVGFNSKKLEVPAKKFRPRACGRVSAIAWRQPGDLCSLQHFH